MSEALQAPPKRTVSFDLDTPALARTYDRVGVRQFEHGKLLIAGLDPKPGEQVLDVGTGTGLLGAYTAAKVAPNGRVIGIDPLPLRIELAASKGQANFETRVGRAEDLSAFADASFDIVYLNSVFHWLADPARALAEIFRVLKPGGRFGVNSGDAERPHQSAVLLRTASERAGIAPERRPHGRNLGAVTNARLRELVEAAGFEGYEGATRTIVDQVPDAQNLIEWSRSSSFGNSVADFDATELSRLVHALTHELQSHRDGASFRLERYLIFAFARKPK
jgi:SAM-dependent methyltransferase